MQGQEGRRCRPHPRKGIGQAVGEDDLKVAFPGTRESLLCGFSLVAGDRNRERRARR